MLTEECVFTNNRLVKNGAARSGERGTKETVSERRDVLRKNSHKKDSNLLLVWGGRGVGREQETEYRYLLASCIFCACQRKEGLVKDITARLAGLG